MQKNKYRKQIQKTSTENKYRKQLKNMIMKTTKDKRVLNAILRKICKENDIDVNNVYISEFGYVKTVDHSKKDADFCSTVYEGVEYKVQYLDGCFNPFILPVKN